MDSFKTGTAGVFPQHFLPVVAFLEQAVADGAFPGAAFGVLHHGTVLATGAAGRFTFLPDSPQVLPGTSFDLASLSKVLSTTAMAMLLWQRNQLDLETPLAELLPEFAGAGLDREIRMRVTLRTLLAHSSGLPATQPFFEVWSGAEAIVQAACRLPLVTEPGTHAAYSDPGFILLAHALEQLAGERLDAFCRREVFSLLNMLHTWWKPEPEEWPLIPPTEDDVSFRRKRVQGQVHDENCWAMGGIAGHAGLFAPVSDVLNFAEAMLAPLRVGGGSTLFHADTVKLFTRLAGPLPGCSRALGWDTPSKLDSSSGNHFSHESFGHLGYTGTSIWIDPMRDISIVLLTNRTFPTRENRKIQKVRPLFHNAVENAMVRAEKR